MSAVSGLKAMALVKGSHAVTCTRLLASIGVLALALQANSAFAQSQSNSATGDQLVEEDRIIKKLYGGIGFGISSLDPDTSEVPGVDNADSANFGGQVMLGLDFNKWLSVEGHAASLGEAEFTPNGSLAYQTFGVSALAYVGKNRHNYNRHGFNGFGRIGYGYLKNTPSDGLRFKQINPSHVLFGAGVEYAMRSGLGVRAEAIAFDADVVYAQLSVLYRIGRRASDEAKPVVKEPKRAPVAVAKPEPKPKPKPVEVPKPAVVPVPKPVIEPAPKIAAAPADNDLDGVQNLLDRCPNTQPGVAVDEVGCDLFTGVIEGVNFNSGSAVLTANAKVILDGVIDTLNRFPAVKLTIMAHTDSQGDGEANKNLSRQRARSVAVYLVRTGGIPTSRLKAYGYGEERPIASNDTAEGRIQNRRVELRAER